MGLGEVKASILVRAMLLLVLRQIMGNMLISTLKSICLLVVVILFLGGMYQQVRKVVRGVCQIYMFNKALILKILSLLCKQLRINTVYFEISTPTPN